MSDTMNTRDQDRLRLLSIFHYVLAAMQVLLALFPVIDLVLGMGIVSGRVAGSPEQSSSYGWALVGSSVLAVALGLALAALTLLAGRRLAARQAHSFCMFVAAINCFFFPFGTILGVLTLIMLKRPAVREAFGARTHLPNVAKWEGRPLP